MSNGPLLAIDRNNKDGGIVRISDKRPRRPNALNRQATLCPGAAARDVSSGGWSRRAVLALAPVGAGAILLPAAQSRNAPTVNSTPPGFFLSSQVLTGEADLNPILAERYWAAFVDAAPEYLVGLRGISGLVRRGVDAEGLMIEVRARGLDAAAAALTTAWFTGTVGRGLGARTVAYAEALMYRTVADGLPPPTYGLGGPAWWTAEPPAAGVAKTGLQLSEAVG